MDAFGAFAVIMSNSNKNTDSNNIDKNKNKKKRTFREMKGTENESSISNSLPKAKKRRLSEKSNIKESMGFASKPTGKAPIVESKTEVIQESEMVARFKKLAGL